MKFLSVLFTISICLSGSTQTFTSYYEDDGLISNSVNCVAVGESGEVWFGTQFGVSHFDGTTWVNYNTDDGLIDNNVTAIFNFDGVLWAGTDFGFSTYDGTTWVGYTQDNGIEDNRIKDFFSDSDGLMWIGHGDGLSSFDGTDFVNYGSGEGLPFGGVSHIAQDNDGNLWLSNGIFGAIMFDGTDFTTFNEDDELLSNSIRAIDISASNKKWIGTASGVSVLDENNVHEEDHEIIFVLPPPDELNPVEDLEIDSQGHVWVGVYVDYLLTVGGVSLYDSGVWSDYDESDGLAGPNVRAIAVDENDGVWVATSTGVTHVTDVAFSVEETEEKRLSVYPNPSTGKVNVLLDNPSDTIKVYSMTGTIVYSEMVKGKQNSFLDLSHLSEGMYHIQYGSKTSRICIQF